MLRSALLVVAALTFVLLPDRASAQARHYALESPDGLGLHNVAAEPATLQGRKGLRLTLSEEGRRRLESLTPEPSAQVQVRLELLASIEGLAFSNGVIEVEIAGAPAPARVREREASSASRSGCRRTTRPTTRSTCAPRMVGPTIKSEGIMQRSTFHFQSGRGSGFARRHLPNTSRTSTSSLENGRKSRSKCAAARRGSTCATTNSRR